MKRRITRPPSNPPRGKKLSTRTPTPRPYVVVNMAMSVDGKIATANRAVTSFGSPRDLRELYRLRSTADAILCGARTVEQSDATLGNGGPEFGRRRLRAGLAEHPLRVVVSGSGSISPAARIWTQRFSPIVILATERARPRLRRLHALTDQVWICGRREVNLKRALERLASRFGVRRLVCEGGGELNDAMFREGLVDELRLTVCPHLFGGSRAPSIADGEGFPSLQAAARFRLHSCRRSGDELFLVYRRSEPLSDDTPRRAG